MPFTARPWELGDGDPGSRRRYCARSGRGPGSGLAGQHRGYAGVLWPVNWTVLRLLCTVCAASTSSRSCSCSWATIITSPRKHAQRPLRCIESTWSLSQVRARTPCFHSFVAMLLPGQRLHLRAPCLPVLASGCCTRHPARCKLDCPERCTTTSSLGAEAVRTTLASDWPRGVRS